MNVTCNLSTLLTLLRDCVGLLDHRTTLPIVSHVLLCAEPGTITLQATDLETGFRGTCMAETHDAGTVTLAGRKLLEILKELPGETVQIASSAQAQKITISAGSSQFILRGLPVTEFPTIPGLDEPAALDLPREDFHAMVSETLGSIGDDDSRHILNTLRIEISAHQIPHIRLVSTDGHRLTKIEQTLGAWRSNEHHEQKVMIPKRATVLMHKLLGACKDETVAIGVTKSLFLLELGSMKVASRLVQGNFPNYGNVIPLMDTAQMEIDRTEFMEALRRMAVMADGQVHAIDLTLTPEGVYMDSQHASLGHAHELVNATVATPRLEARLNAKYLLDALNTSPADTIRFHMEDPLKPCVLTNGDPSRWLVVIMPIKK